MDDEYSIYKSKSKNINTRASFIKPETKILSSQIDKDYKTPLKIIKDSLEYVLDVDFWNIMSIYM